MREKSNEQRIKKLEDLVRLLLKAEGEWMEEDIECV